MSIPELLIREIRVRPVVAPLPRLIRTASGDVLDAPLLLIDVLPAVGVTGRAYAFAYTPLTLRSRAQFVRDIAFYARPLRPRHGEAAEGCQGPGAVLSARLTYRRGAPEHSCSLDGFPAILTATSSGGGQR